MVENAFDSVDWNVIWKLMHHYGISSKFIKLIKDLYEPGLLAFPPVIFLMVVVRIMREVEDHEAVRQA